MWTVGSFPIPLVPSALTVALIWYLTNEYAAYKVIWHFLPHSTKTIIEDKASRDPDLKKMMKVNSTACVHALIVVPIALYDACFCEALRRDPYNGVHWSFDAIGLVMCGYFLWDVIICLMNTKLYSRAFLLHGLLSLMGLWSQLSATSHRLSWYVAVFMGTEVSTPLLHIRWFLLKARQSDTTYFKIINVLFLAAYAIYRLVLVAALVAAPFFYECVVQKHTADMSSITRTVMISVLALWMALNYYWGARVIKTQLFRAPQVKSKEL